MKIIAFTGTKGSGKDTAANYIHKKIKESGREITSFAFADGLKIIVHNTFNISMEDAEILKRDPIFKLGEFTLREVYQRLGEEIKSEFNKNIWIDQLLNKIEESTSNIITITDLRYLNEEKELRRFCEDNNHTLIIIKMVRVVNMDQMSVDGHISEQETHLIGADFTVTAETPQEIYQKLNMINEINKKEHLWPKKTT